MSTVALTEEMLELLREGAKTSYGRCAYPGQLRRSYPLRKAANELAVAKLIRWDVETPIITDAGREAIGGAAQEKLVREELDAYGPARRAQASIPRSRRDEILKGSKWKNVRFAMLLVVHNETDNWMQVSVDGRPNKAPPIFIKSKFGEPEMVVTKRSGRFIVAHVIGAEVMRRNFRITRVPLLSKDIEWTKDELAAWRALRLDMLALQHELEKQRWRAKGHKPEPTKYRFGESA